MKSLINKITIYPKLIITFLVVLIPLFSLSLVMNEYGSSNVRTEITNSMQSKVHFYNSALENEFTQIIQLMKEVAGTNNLALLSNRSEIMNAYEQRVSIQELQKELSIIKNASQYVKTAEVHITSIDRTISNNSFGTIPRDEFQALNVVTNIYESPFIYWQDRLFISLPYPIQSNNLNPEFVIDIELSVDLLKDALRQFTNLTTGSTIWASVDKDWNISGNHQANIPNERKFLDEIDSTISGLKQIEIHDQRYLVAYERSKILGTTLVMYELERTVLGPLRFYAVWFWVISCLSLIVILFVSYSVYRLIHRPLKNLIRAFRRVEQGDLNLPVNYSGHDEFRYLYTQFNAMVRNLQQMIYEVYEQKYRVQHAELKQLQSQINPHFLYNSLFIIYRLAIKNGDEIQIRFTKHLSDYFQFITRNSNDEVSLAEEVQHAKNYVEIQMIRFANQIEVVFPALPAAFAQLAVPRLVLQPIIENAYKHGLEHRESGGKLLVSFAELDDTLQIIVSDNGICVDEDSIKRLQIRLEATEVNQETTGLINVHRRLRSCFGPPYGLTLSTSHSDPFTVTLKLPKNKDVVTHVQSFDRGQ